MVICHPLLLITDMLETTQETEVYITYVHEFIYYSL